MQKKKLYVGCSLTHATPKFRADVEALKDTLREEYEVLDFIGMKDATPQEILEHDSKCVRECDCFLAICTLPSLGLGFEIALALEHNKHVLLVEQKGSNVSRMIAGITHPNFAFAQYEDLFDVVDILKQKFGV